MKIRQGLFFFFNILFVKIYIFNYIYIYFNLYILSISYSPPPKKTGRFEFSQNNHYLSDDYSDDEEEHLHSK